jgi:hypothetical protein
VAKNQITTRWGFSNTQVGERSVLLAQACLFSLSGLIPATYW